MRKDFLKEMANWVVINRKKITKKVGLEIAKNLNLTNDEMKELWDYLNTKEGTQEFVSYLRKARNEWLI